MTSAGGKGKGQTWEGYKDEYVMCEGMEGCEVWQLIRVREEWWNPKKQGKFLCGICLGKMLDSNVKETEKWKKKAEKAEKALEKMEKEVKRDEKREDKQKDERKQYADKMKEQLRQHKEELVMKQGEVEHRIKEDLSKEMIEEVKRNQRDEERKRKMMVFGLKKGEISDEVMVQGMLDCIKTPTEVKPVKVERLREKEHQLPSRKEVCRPIMVEFRSEAEKWQVMERKRVLGNTEGFKKVFLELDLPREERELAKMKRLARKRETKRRKELGPEIGRDGGGRETTTRKQGEDQNIENTRMGVPEVPDEEEAPEGEEEEEEEKAKETPEKPEEMEKQEEGERETKREEKQEEEERMEEVDDEVTLLKKTIQTTM